MFRFSLDTVLEVRTREEKIKMKEMSDVAEVKAKIEDYVQGIQGRLVDLDHDLHSQMKGGLFSIEQIRFNDLFKQKMKVDLEKGHENLEKANQFLEQKRQELIEASQKRKALEILREKEKKAYWVNIARHEKIEMDEIAASQFFQKNYR